MREQEAKKWCSVLNEAEIGDVVTINGHSVKVTLCDVGETCSRCAFHENGKDCELSACGYTIPCSPFNNTNGKRIIFSRVLKHGKGGHGVEENSKIKKK